MTRGGIRLSNKMKKLWADPAWHDRQVALIREGQRDVMSFRSGRHIAKTHVDDRMWEALNRTAAKHGVTRGELIRTFIVEGLKDCQ